VGLCVVGCSEWSVGPFDLNFQCNKGYEKGDMISPVVSQHGFQTIIGVLYPKSSLVVP